MTTVTIHPTVKKELEEGLGELSGAFIEAYNIQLQMAYDHFKNIEIASKIAMQFICSEKVSNKIAKTAADRLA